MYAVLWWEKCTIVWQFIVEYWMANDRKVWPYGGGAIYYYFWWLLLLMAGCWLLLFEIEHFSICTDCVSNSVRFLLLFLLLWRRWWDPNRLLNQKKKRIEINKVEKAWGCIDDRFVCHLLFATYRRQTVYWVHWIYRYRSFSLHFRCIFAPRIYAFLFHFFSASS